MAEKGSVDDTEPFPMGRIAGQIEWIRVNCGGRITRYAETAFEWLSRPARIFAWLRGGRRLAAQLHSDEESQRRVRRVTAGFRARRSDAWAVGAVICSAEEISAVCPAAQQKI